LQPNHIGHAFLKSPVTFSEILTSGKIFHGAAGFARVWCVLPAPWRVLGKIATFAPVTWIMEIGYRLTLKVRPMIARRFFGAR